MKIHHPDHGVDHAGPRLIGFEKRSEWPMAGLAAAFLVVYSIDILAEGLSHRAHHALQIADLVIWALFAVDYVWRISLAIDRFSYWWRHLGDLAIIALPVLRPLRLLRLVLLFRVLNRPMVESVHGKVAVYGVTGAGLLVYCAALAELDAERHASAANIKNFGDALWWAVVTICTVGYGDRYPVTGEGRLVGAGLMIGGVALLAAITASFATWLIDRLRSEQAVADSTARDEAADVREQMAALVASHERDTAAMQAQLARIEAALSTRQVDALPESASS